jgi:hypothetical protein
VRTAVAVALRMTTILVVVAAAALPVYVAVLSLPVIVAMLVTMLSLRVRVAVLVLGLRHPFALAPSRTPLSTKNGGGGVVRLVLARRLGAGAG